MARARTASASWLDAYRLEPRGFAPAVGPPIEAFRLVMGGGENIARGTANPSVMPMNDTLPHVPHSSMSHPSFRPNVGSDAYSEAARKRRDLRVARGRAVHKCGVCWKPFARKSHLDEHESRHNNERLFACSQHGCAMRFNTKGDRTSHVKRMHKKNAQN
ncbi:hypothetical protein BD626DRAFT_519535 [Schizophyllum amplum]|uniref:C2H2-type domain-containing protein n=1 Tax=Schizophyllum amplum TaxID=97359 RepID=A0A550BVB1_9AGAR|nr:hypothetical protein BD626DRAFT_519535 [Auriculariopsis ampla]